MNANKSRSRYGTKTRANTILVPLYHVRSCLFGMQVCKRVGNTPGRVKSRHSPTPLSRPYSTSKRIGSRGLTTDINVRNNINLVAVDVGADPCTTKQPRGPQLGDWQGNSVRPSAKELHRTTFTSLRISSVPATTQHSWAVGYFFTLLIATQVSFFLPLLPLVYT